MPFNNNKKCIKMDLLVETLNEKYQKYMLTSDGKNLFFQSAIWWKYTKKEFIKEENDECKKYNINTSTIKTGSIQPSLKNILINNDSCRFVPTKTIPS